MLTQSLFLELLVCKFWRSVSSDEFIRVLIIYGPRAVRKRTAYDTQLSPLNKNIFYVTFDDSNNIICCLQWLIIPLWNKKSLYIKQHYKYWLHITLKINGFNVSSAHQILFLGHFIKYSICWTQFFISFISVLLHR